ncbi:MAG: MFS transporter [Alphaproteobacteria bacterium]|nr:MFS transporter [Alphaproteobacteria bacterium]
MKRLLLSIYGFAFFNKFLLLTPVYAIFMQQNGVGDALLSAMFIISSAATILGQMPIAYITNRCGARNAMAFGQILKAVAVIMWLYISNTTGFVVGMVLWGIQTGFRNVAFEGMIYDEVAAAGRAKEYTRILGRKATFESIGVALSATGSLLMFLGYDWVTWVSVVAIVISVLCLMLIPNRKSESDISHTGFKAMFRDGVRTCIKTPCMMPIMMLALLVVNVPYLDDFLSPIALQLGIKTEMVGIVPFFLLICATFGQRFAYKFKNISDTLLYTMIGVAGGLYVLFAHVYNVQTLWMLGVAYTLIWCVYTITYARFQHMIPTRHRSVVLSLFTTLTYLVYMLVCAIIGIGATIGSWRYSIWFLGMLVIAVCVWAMIRVRKKCPCVSG